MTVFQYFFKFGQS